MALLWADGFDDLATSTGTNVLSVVGRRYLYYSSSGSTYPYSRSPRFSGYSINSEGTAYLIQNHLNTTCDTLIVGCAVYLSTNSTSWYDFVSLYDGDTEGINFRIYARYGLINAYRGGTWLGTSSGYELRYNCWHYVEMKVKCHPTEGSVEVRIGGQTVLSLTGINTQQGSHAYHNIPWFCLSSAFYIDDLYVADSTGALNNDFLGNVQIRHLLPTGDAGANEWTPSTGSSHYALVDEGVENYDTDYVASSTTDQIDLWNYEDISGIGNIFGVQLMTVIANTDVSLRYLKTIAKSGSTTDEGESKKVGNTRYDVCARIVETDPDTSLPWTALGINAAQFGVKAG